MNLVILIPVSLVMGLVGLGAFIWALRHDQFSDPEGNAWRILEPDGVDAGDDAARAGGRERTTTGAARAPGRQDGE